MSGENANAKSASKRKQPETDVVHESTTTSTEPKQKKQKNSKDKSNKEVIEAQESTVVATEEGKEEKKSKKAAKKTKTAESREPAPQEEVTPITSTEPKSEPAVEQEEPITKDDSTEAAISGEVPKKKKERKRNKNNRKQTGQDEAAKADTGNGTPEEDASLTEQAQKGIQYAWLYTHRNLKSLPEGGAKDDGTYWKFNKARQGWLWKNVWNEEIIPSKYVELVIGYLSSMQGQARQKLMEEAQKIVDTPVLVVEEPAKEEAAPADEEEAKEKEEVAENTEEPAVEAGPAGETEDKPESVSAEKHRRAQLVVDSLRS
ncbi:hypothetical protein QFC22_003238 [Naganishia vaughanmartiniae]|uniref:Uncharacterized protein n=1 Tax=Naganishia vaughanmartiniae TaxID=1424756 RepID=A0ACC2X647_9TREE|nr:hypothetical protein QFC22_003238 [Naganishia vaughanmartiniae]